jgi:CubicO group peptidase (beta-lactamase class C family)
MPVAVSVGSSPDRAELLHPGADRRDRHSHRAPRLLGDGIRLYDTLGGHQATAHGLAAMFNAVLQGMLVDSARLAELSALAFEGVDQVFGTTTRMALGFPIGRIGAPAAENSVAFGWPGGGGSYAYADPARGVAFALTKTRLRPNFDTALSVTTILADHLAGTR